MSEAARTFSKMLAVGSRVRLVVVALLVGAVVANAAPAPKKTAKGGAAHASRYLIYTKLEIDRGIAGHTLVAVEFKGDSFSVRPLYTTRPTWARRLLTVVGGKLYLIVERNLIEVDLRTGERRLVASGIGRYRQHRSGRLYCRVGDRLRVYDFRRGAFRDAMTWPLASPSIYSRFAISPDGARIAFPESPGGRKSKAKDLPGAKPSPSGLRKGYHHILNTRLVVGNLATGELLRLPTPFASPFPQGGGPRFRPPPPLVWRDAKTILLVRGDRAQEGRPIRGLAIVNADTGVMRDVTPIPGDHHNVPSFAVTRDQEVRLVLSRSSGVHRAYRIGFESGRLVEDTQLVPHVNVSHKGGRHLVYKGRPVKGSENITQVRVSPDGGRVAWSVSHRNFIHQGLRVFDLATQRVRVVSDDFMLGGLLWADEKDMAPGELPAAPKGWVRMKATSVVGLIQRMRDGTLSKLEWEALQVHLAGRRFKDYQDLLIWWWTTPMPGSAGVPVRVEPGKLRALWPRLSGKVGPEACEATRTFMAAGDKGVAFLAEHVRPVSIDDRRIRALIAELDDDKHAVRARAFAELSRIGRPAGPALQEALKAGPSAEVRTRVEQLIAAGTNPYPATPEARRMARAVRILELIATSRAMKVLGALAKGDARARATTRAKAALGRVEKKKAR